MATTAVDPPLEECSDDTVMVRAEQVQMQPILALYQAAYSPTQLLPPPLPLGQIA